MQIKKLLLRDFRCFDEFTIEFSEKHQIHVLIAENMVGKSAVMAALRLAANTYTSGLKTEKQLQISDHRIIGHNPIADITPDVSIHIIANIFTSHNTTTESTWLKYKTKPHGEKTKVEIIKGPDPRKESKLVNRLVAEGKAVQPLFGYIGTEYIHVASSDTVSWEVNGKSTDGYKGCFEDKSIKNFLFRWLGRMDSIVAEMSRKSIIAESYGDIPANAISVFQEAVKSILADVEVIEWSADLKQPTVKLKNGDIRPFSLLSDGYRYLILLAGELATRAFILNKHLGRDVLQQIHGVVLIDEFGIHLHPALQNDALIRLQQTFPLVQFIVSTHSPLLVNGLKKEQVHILTTDKAGKRIVTHPEEDIIGLGANEILTKIFGLESTMDNTFLQWDDQYKELFAKKSQRELSEGEAAEFEMLAKKLAPLRLDPAIAPSLIAEDPITAMVKDKLINRSMDRSIKMATISEGSVSKQVGDILDDFFTSNAK
jgi:predicted ATP-binding protein involved in virulence